VAIAQAIVNKPTIFCRGTDQTGSLNSKTAGDFISLLKQLKIEGQTVIMVPHN